jgi:hypothetical protein
VSLWIWFFNLTTRIDIGLFFPILLIQLIIVVVNVNLTWLFFLYVNWRGYCGLKMFKMSYIERVRFVLLVTIRSKCLFSPHCIFYSVYVFFDYVKFLFFWLCMLYFAINLEYDIYFLRIKKIDTINVICLLWYKSNLKKIKFTIICFHYQINFYIYW